MFLTCSFLLNPILSSNLDPISSLHGISPFTFPHPKCGSPPVQEWVCHVIIWIYHMAPMEHGHVRAVAEA